MQYSLDHQKSLFDLATTSSSNTVLYYCTAGPTEIDDKVCDFHRQPINWKFD